MAEEENFPRGGRRVNTVKRSVKNDENLFQIHKPPKAKKSKTEKKRERGENLTEDIFQSYLKIHGTLTYSKIQDGMIILGCVRHITNFALEVELPGLTFATVGVTNISDPFTKYLNKKLEENDEESETALKNIFKCGQFLPVKILAIESKEKGVHTSTHVIGSINPRDLYSEKNHTNFKKGLIAWGCIKSVLDHGYEISFGVKNCRVFLPSKNVEKGKEYLVGEPLWCAVHKCDSQDVATTLRVSAKELHIYPAKTEDVDGLHDIIPGMQVEFVTDKITSCGIQGKFLDNYFGYVDESHLKQSLQKVTDYKEGKIITAYVLYVEPATKITHLTLRKPSEVPKPTLNIKNVVSGEVFGRTRNGILLKLPNKEKGFVSNNRLLKSLTNKSNDVVTVIQTKYSEGSKHACRVLDYNHLQNMYICTVEQNLIKSKPITSLDLSLGQLVKVSIEQIKNDGIVVSFGTLRGFVPNLHVSNIQYTDNIKKKFTVGSKVNARVLKIDDTNVLFTLKQGLIESESCLSKLEEAKPGNSCTGVVVQTKAEGVLVAFYGNIRGWLNSFSLPRSGGERPDPTKYFFRGQVITAWISKVTEDMVTLILQESKEFKEVAKTGEKIIGIVEKISKNDITVSSEDKRYRGTVPVNHLSVSLSLCIPMKNTLKIGDKIDNLICVNNKPSHIFSRREAVALKDRKYLKKFENLRTGFIIRCSYVSDCQTGIYVMPLILNYHEKVLVQHKDIINKNEKLHKFQPHQCLLAKVCDINIKTKTLRLSIKFEAVYEKSIEASVQYFSDYLMDLAYIRQYGSENNWNICQYSPGQRILCNIEKIANEGGCLVSLPNGIKGLVAPYLCPDNIKVGQSLEGVFLSEDFRDNYAEMCLKKDIWQKINKTQSGKLETDNLSSCFAEKILVKSDFVIAVLKHNKQLIYLPNYLNPNDFNGCLPYYQERIFKICICGKVGTHLIGMSKALFMKLDKTRATIIANQELRKTKQGINSSVDDTEDTAIDSGLEVEDNSDENEESGKESNENNEKVTEEAESSESEDEVVFTKNVKDTQQNDVSVEKNTIGHDANGTISGQKRVLPGVSTFFNIINDEKEELSSSDEEELEQVRSKKKKLTPTERAEVLRQEEEKILKIENELADLNKTPESAAQFDRLVLAHPDSSKIWINYISFHIAATEIDKARAVAKRALETINMTNGEEKFKVWVVLLNWENMFGTKESFEKVLEDALKFNDPLKIYLQIVRILAEAGKYREMEEKVKKMKGKYKQDPNMWLELAKVYYQINNFKEARNMKDGALKCISDKKTQLNLIVRFAIMEFKYGEEDQGAAIFETILSSDPRKVIIWTTYVDQLVKKSKIDQARIVLERAVCQRLPVKSMRALFLKFRKLEEDHGTQESLEAVKQRAQEYVYKVKN